MLVFKRTVQEILDLAAQMSSLDNLEGLELAFALSKNEKTLTPNVEAYKKATAPSKAFQEFQAEQRKLFERFAIKDEKGKPVQKVDESGNAFLQIDPAKVEEHQTAAAALVAQYSVAIEARRKQFDDAKNLVELEVTLEMYPIKKEWIPANVTKKQMGVLLNFME